MSLKVGQFTVLWGDENPEEMPNIGEAASFRYEDSLDSDNLLVLDYVKCPFDVADRPELQQGQKVTVSWGRGQSLADPVAMYIEEPEVEYGSGITMTIRAHDKGTETKGVIRHRTWPESTSLKDVVEEIAGAWGLTPDVEPYDGEFDRVQKKESDFRYLQREAEKIGYRFWIDLDTLHFRPDAVGAPSIIFVYRSGNLLKNFKATTERQQKKGSQTKTVAVGFNMKSRVSVNGEATAETDTDVQLSGGYVTIDAETGNLTEVEGKRILTPKSNQADVDRAAHGARKQAARGQQRATVEVPGLPFLRAGVFIQIEGVAQTYAGLWRIAKSIHTIGSRGYGTTLTLDRETTGTRVGGQAVGEGTVPPARINEAEAATGEDEIINAETGEVIIQ